ncbi:MAG: heat-inducible transcription repressor HrcA [Gammaproteobacteria bacterium]|nr:heat-inducible transcription repressor HrcA [Gammaproteobacteria bacterium]
MQGTELNERAQHMLKVLIQRYLLEGQPVGSRALSRDSGLKLSPATIRNVMSDLEDAGFVASPHTSAGRVPTVQGYRFFVDSLLSVTSMECAELGALQQQLSGEKDRAILLESASSILSGVTQMAGIVTLPRADHLLIDRVEFLSLGRSRVLVVLEAGDTDVQNRIMHTERDFSPSELEYASNYLSALLAGKNLSVVRRLLLNELRSVQEDVSQMMVAAVDMASQGIDLAPLKNDYLLAGETNLMGNSGLNNVDKLRGLFEAFNQKQDILHLLDQCIDADGVQIFIGEESGYQALDECSVVSAPYSIDNQVVGVLGVIGPTRMAYDRVIPIVDATARLLGAALNLKK